MARRSPDFADLGSSSFHPFRNRTPSPGDFPLGHVPPTLSPLDALALQGYKLAMKFEESQNNGRRISRLPHVTIANELARPRPAYFNALLPATSMSDKDQTNQSGDSEPSGTNSDADTSDIRPKSYYPFIHTCNDAASIISRDSGAFVQESGEAITEQKPMNAKDYFDMVRSISPEPLDRAKRNQRTPITSATATIDFAPGQPSQRIRKNFTVDSIKSNVSTSLASSQSPAHSRSPKMQSSDTSVRMDSGDECDWRLSFQGDPYDLRTYNRERPASSGSTSYLALSPAFVAPRSLSMSSEFSVCGPHHSRESVNYSRPMSRQGGTTLEAKSTREGLNNQSSSADSSFDVSFVQESIDSPMLTETSYLSEAGHAHDTLPNHQCRLSTEHRLSEPTLDQPPSDIYPKYSPPRERILLNDSTLAQDSHPPMFEWKEQPFSNSTVTYIREELRIEGNLGMEAAKESGELEIGHTPQHGSLHGPSFVTHPVGTSHTNILSTIPARLQPISVRATVSPKCLTRTRSMENSTTSSKHISNHKSNPSYPPASNSSPASSTCFSSSVGKRVVQPTIPTLTVDKNFTPTLARIQKPNFTAITAPPPDHLSAETHLTIGIACHEQGSLQKSTYHLRIAARAGLPTAMLLYALACRHGWGMRPNQADGVGWLRKAVDSAGLEVADDNNALLCSSSRANPTRNTGADRKTHKAQLALSIYELGVSYVNGWGIAQDKPLALRCFEIAGSWGDGDALAEAGFCYAKGVGCRKDLKKAAEFYRAAEARGFEMAGNSW